MLDDVRLLVGEIVTNSIRHAQITAEQSLHLVASLRTATLRLELHDAGTIGTVARRTPGQEDGGFGLTWSRNPAHGASSVTARFADVEDELRDLAAHIRLTVAGAGAGRVLAERIGARLLEGDPVTAAESISREVAGRAG